MKGKRSMTEITREHLERLKRDVQYHKPRNSQMTLQVLEVERLLVCAEHYLSSLNQNQNHEKQPHH